jgi:Ser-tRNA(Ala) deacylase AlaX
MSTYQLYLTDTYLFESEAVVTGRGKDERGEYIVLDRTVFYPQGGGQPSDTGALTRDHEDRTISFVGFVDGEVRHYGDVASLEECDREPVVLRVNQDGRLLYAKYHTAGHLVCSVAEAVDPHLRGAKGFHYPNGAYVEFTGIKPSAADGFLGLCNDRLASFMGRDIGITAAEATLAELRRICPHVPPNLPDDKQLRVVTIGGFPPIPCGGTHLRSLKELSEVVITKMKEKQGNIRLSYHCR